MIHVHRGPSPWRFCHRVMLVAGFAALAATPFATAHSPTVDASLRDWCVGAFSNTAPGGGRQEDTGIALTCGNCSANSGLACEQSSDCPSGQSCVNVTSRTEIAWWDDRTDGAVNDLATVAITQDMTNLYIAAELWVDPDPVSLPFGQIAIDHAPGGLGSWHDPSGMLRRPGHCSLSTDRACARDEDCHFCQLSTEPLPSTRVRACGSGCDPDINDVCLTNETCVDLGAGGPQSAAGFHASPIGFPDHLVLFDFSLWLIGAGDAVLLMQPGSVVDPNPWDPVLGCAPDFAGDTTACDFPPAVNPGASGGSGGPPGSVEVAIPWSAFGCTGCPGACSCPGFGPGQPFRFSMIVARGTLTLDFAPDGALEDVVSEAVAGTTTTSTNSCAGFGIGNTSCETDGSLDAFVPRTPVLPHETPPGGRVVQLTMSKAAGSSINLDWFPSCSADDVDYEVYEGMLGNWYSHQPVVGFCMTGGTSATFDPSAGSSYYLVVPTNGVTEGSYGTSTAGERPVGAMPCAAQVLGSCP
ncbi:MAG TPA: hypothetical protein VD788_11545 [Candidatus Polarisedimenticolaceae bacterium]|nr:hypothetical protein [Candidatus Polarisedimenticolaceae bacterium]